MLPASNLKWVRELDPNVAIGMFEAVSVYAMPGMMTRVYAEEYEMLKRANDNGTGQVINRPPSPKPDIPVMRRGRSSFPVYKDDSEMTIPDYSSLENSSPVQTSGMINRRETSRPVKDSDDTDPTSEATWLDICPWCEAKVYLPGPRTSERAEGCVRTCRIWNTLKRQVHAGTGRKGGSEEREIGSMVARE